MSTIGALLSTPRYGRRINDWYQDLLSAHRRKPHPEFIVKSIHHYKSIYDGDKQNEFLYLHVIPRLPHPDSKHQPSIYILIQRTVTETWLYYYTHDEFSVLSGEDDSWNRSHHRNQKLLRSLSWLDSAGPRLLDVVNILVNTSRIMGNICNLGMRQLYGFTRIGYEVVKHLYPGNNDTGNEILEKYRQQPWFFTIFGRKAPFALSRFDYWVIENVVRYRRLFGIKVTLVVVPRGITSKRQKIGRSWCTDAEGSNLVEEAHREHAPLFVKRSTRTKCTR
ncbi:hypothetical protein PAXINDRAFT_156857 [Paxillus involutus ATCC 200175]|uniref:Unplaced genomic scaffold PAXINscaffold_39, whole genome shotgun sequence n=1 Tax=Paxillus involutus ATCC 200175 TaxID=664439 RepID=A0A0C9TYD5_PAXIN|nr:hypothetical protein PAXINDRAFT_156857 [Paxillus involutus ATCC 200175]